MAAAAAGKAMRMDTRQGGGHTNTNEAVSRTRQDQASQGQTPTTRPAGCMEGRPATIHVGWDKRTGMGKKTETGN